MQIIMKHYSHKVGTNFWHLEWCPKYRYQMMRKLENKTLLLLQSGRQQPSTRYKSIIWQ